MANIIESRVTLEDEVFEETIDTAEEPIEVVRPTSYNDLQDLPQINGVTLQGNKTSSDLGIVTQNDINSAVSAEATLRENADTALGGRIDGEITNRTNADNALGTRIDNEILARQGGDNNLQTQIDAITSKSDVVDVVANYAALQAYDTSTLGNNDVVKVLDDETHEDALTYYRWSTTTQTWTYIGQEAPYYSKGQMDVKLAEKQDKLTAGANIQIQNGTISATDTKYTNGNGLNLNGTEFSANTDVLATKEDLEGYYTKPETDNLLAPKLEAEVVAELPTTGAEGKLYLTPKAHTTSTATGNPIEATITEQAGQLESFRLDGDTFQQTYTGKNLFNKNNPNMFVGYVGWNGGINSTSADRMIYIPCEPNTTYSIQKPVPTTNPKFRVAVSSDVPTNGGTATVLTNDSYMSLGEATVTTREDSAYLMVYIWVNSSDMTLDEVLSGIQIEVGSSVSSYEPYVGGQPSPNPDYPQQIQTVTGEQTVEVVGKNLFDKDNYNILNCWPTSVLAHGNNWSIWIPCEPNTTYSVTKMICQPTDHNRFRIATTAVEPNYDVAVVDAVNPGTNNTTGQITTGATAKYLMVVLANTDTAPTTTLSEMLGSVQIEVGSATTYAPYSKQTYQLNLGKNLFDGTIYKTDYVLSSNGAETPFTGAVITSSIKVQPNTTYTVSANIQSIHDKYMRVGIYQGDMTFISRPSSSVQDGKLTFTTPANAQYVRLSYFVPATDVQLEVGSTASDFAPYFTPIELCKLGTYQDYIYKDGDSWKVHKATKKITVDGSENWVYPDSGANYTFFQFSRNNFRSKYGNAADFYASNTEVGFAKADKFEQIVASSANMRTKQGIGFSTEGNGWFRISVANTIATTVDAFKTWLSSHSTTIDYALATPTDTIITDANLISQLEAIRTASLQNGANTISNTATGTNLAGDMEIGYFGFNPTNRYDKFIWLDLNNNYEQIGGE